MEPSGVSVEVTKSCTNKDHCQSENGKQARVVSYLQMEYVESKKCFTAHHTFALTENMIAFAKQHFLVQQVPDTYAKSVLMSLKF